MSDETEFEFIPEASQRFCIKSKIDGTVARAEIHPNSVPGEEGSFTIMTNLSQNGSPVDDEEFLNGWGCQIYETVENAIMDLKNFFEIAPYQDSPQEHSV